MPRNYGHAQGSKNVEIICEEAYKMGIEYLTVYAFSTENWKRPKDEVDALMKLLRNYMKTCLKTAEKNRINIFVCQLLQFIGKSLYLILGKISFSQLFKSIISITTCVSWKRKMGKGKRNAPKLWSCPGQ